MGNRWPTLFVAWLMTIVTIGPVVGVWSATARAENAPATRPVTVVGRVAHRVAECSGIVASRRHPGIYWVHSDSGNAAAIYAINRRGEVVAEFPVEARNQDWEDIAIDEAGRIYIGDIGNNGGKRKQLVVYRVNEPDPATAVQGRGRALKVTGRWRIRFPEMPFDCESLFVHKGNGYVISKLFTGVQAAIYRFSLRDQAEPVVLEKVVTLPIRSPVTAADMSADGERLAVLTVTGLNLFDVAGEVSGAGQVKPAYIPYLHARMEACGFTEDGVLVIPETREMLLFAVPK